MFRTLLFDLDGTLLDLDIDEFLPVYFRALTARFAHLMEPKEFVAKLMASTAAMIQNKDPQVTNEEAFMADFIPRIGLPPEELFPILNDFYANDFGNLHEHARRKPLAAEIIRCALDKGLEVVIATNPVFPHLAINHRLCWAGVQEFPYQLVTTYEIMHFCKPYPEYYEEILTRLGRDPEECLMIGNDVQEDLTAREIGVKTFLVKDHMINRNGAPPKTDYEGYMEDLYQFIKKL